VNITGRVLTPYVSFVVNLSVLQDISCLVLGNSVGRIHIQNLKIMFTLYPSLLSKLQRVVAWVTSHSSVQMSPVTKYI
jgi:hypothetical protein